MYDTFKSKASVLATAIVKGKDYILLIFSKNLLPQMGICTPIVGYFLCVGTSVNVNKYRIFFGSIKSFRFVHFGIEVCAVIGFESYKLSSAYGKALVWIFGGEQTGTLAFIGFDKVYIVRNSKT